MSPISKDYINAAEFAKQQNVHVKTVYRWVKNGEAPDHEIFAGMFWFGKKAASGFRPPVRGRRKNTRKGLVAGKEPANT
jgi:hypothetical protein